VVTNLYCSNIQPKADKGKFVQYYIQQLMQQRCMDIKYLYVHGVGRNALVQTVLDVYRHMEQEFTHEAIPEENAFIISYHCIVERSIERRYEFESIYDRGWS